MKENFNKSFLNEITKIDIINISSNLEINSVIKGSLLELYMYNKEKKKEKVIKIINKLLNSDIIVLSILVYILEIIIKYNNQELLNKLVEVLMKKINNETLNIQINNSKYWNIISYETIIKLFEIIYFKKTNREGILNINNIFKKYKEYASSLDKDINSIFENKDNFTKKIIFLRKNIKTKEILTLEYKIAIIHNLFKDIMSLKDKNFQSLIYISMVSFIFTDKISEQIIQKELEIYNEKEKTEKLKVDKLQLEKENAEIKVKTIKNTLQTVTHSLGNSMQEMNNYIDEPVKHKNRLKRSFNLAKSLLLSIKEYNGNNQKFKEFCFFRKKSNNRITFSSLFYYVLYNYLDALFRGDINSILEGDIDSFLNIDLEVKKKIKNIRKNDFFEFIEFNEDSISKFKKYFNSNDFNFISKYFDINLELLDKIYLDSKNSMTFNIIYVILDELIKNMFKYSDDKNRLKVEVINTKDSYEISFINSFKKINKSESGTLAGLNMVEMYAKDLGGFGKKITDSIFSVVIYINKSFVKE